ncbi:MAG: hypothetical protein WD876_04005 [Candidatus Pacearchaeota archaeon]
MKIFNEITMEIVKNTKGKESIHSLANKIGFAYSAVYKWVLELEKYGVVSLIRKGNKNTIITNKNEIYQKFKQLGKAISVVEKDNIFWDLIKKSKLRIRFVKGTAATIWTKGNFITGDFYDRIYFLEVEKTDKKILEETLEKKGIKYTEEKQINERPLIYITEREKLDIEKEQGLPMMPLKELVKWAKKLQLENILEHLDNIHNLGLQIKYSEVSGNA